MHRQEGGSSQPVLGRGLAELEAGDVVIECGEGAAVGSERPTGIQSGQDLAQSENSAKPDFDFARAYLVSAGIAFQALVYRKAG